MRKIFLSTQIFVTIVFLFSAALRIDAQITAFSFQGRLLDGGAPASSLYDIEFRLFDAETGGNQLGPTQTFPGHPVPGGIFSVELDFGSEFTGEDRWIEIAIRPAGTGEFTTLSPRNKILSAPQSVVAIEALSLNCLLCVTDAQIDSVSGDKVDGPVANAANASNLSGLPASRFVQSDVDGNVGIGAAPAAGSKLTVGGQIEITSGGLKFPDSTTQSSAGLTSVVTTAPLTGNGTDGSPLGIQSVLTVINADNPARQPFFKQTANEDLLNLYNVPAGKTLVIEHISGSIRTPTTQGTPVLSFGALDLSSSIQLVHSFSIANSDSTTSWFYSSSVKYYLPPGKRLAMFIAGPTTITAQQLRINGHLVDTP
jgi:hypothetical protein